MRAEILLCTVCLQKLAVGSSNRFPFRSRTYTQTHGQIHADATAHPTHASATAGVGNQNTRVSYTVDRTGQHRHSHQLTGVRTFRRHIQLHKDRIPRHRHPRRHPPEDREDVGEDVGVVECGLYAIVCVGETSDIVVVTSVGETSVLQLTSPFNDRVTPWVS